MVVTRVHCGQTVHPRPIVIYYGTLIGTPTPGIQWYKFRPPGVTPNRGMGAFCRITLTSCYKLLRLQIHNCAQLNVILLFSRNIEASCHKHFVVVSREQQTTPPLTCHCPARLCVHVLHLAVQPLTARAEDRYWPRIGDFCLPLRQNIAVTFGMEKLEWCGYAKVTNF